VHASSGLRPVVFYPWALVARETDPGAGQSEPFLAARFFRVQPRVMTTRTTDLAAPNATVAPATSPKQLERN
jgi:hypothetical protein